METIENNKLIAEFMGMELGDDKTMYFDDAENLHPPTPIDQLKYHESWDWLMPVVEKINNTKDSFGNKYDFQIGNGYVWVDQHIGDRIFFSGNQINHREESMISKGYRGVVNFIKWYNEKN
jgi:hypothetical protein